MLLFYDYYARPYGMTGQELADIFNSQGTAKLGLHGTATQQVWTASSFPVKSNHRPFWKVRKTGEFIFTMFRDPLERALSRYNELENLEKEPYHYLVSNGLESFTEKVPDSELKRQLFTFSEALDVEVAIKAASSLNFVLFLDTFDQDVNALSLKMGVKLDTSLPKIGKGEYRKISKEELLNSEKAQKLREKLESEYRFYEAMKTLKEEINDKAV